MKRLSMVALWCCVVLSTCICALDDLPDTESAEFRAGCSGGTGSIAKPSVFDQILKLNIFELKEPLDSIIMAFSALDILLSQTLVVKTCDILATLTAITGEFGDNLNLAELENKIDELTALTTGTLLPKSCDILDSATTIEQAIGQIDFTETNTLLSILDELLTLTVIPKLCTIEQTTTTLLKGIRPINAPTVITEPGVYCVVSDITAASTILNIQSDQVTVRLEGHVLEQTTPGIAAIDLAGTGSQSQILIENGFVTVTAAPAISSSNQVFDAIIRDIVIETIGVGILLDEPVNTKIERVCTSFPSGADASATGMRITNAQKLFITESRVSNNYLVDDQIGIGFDIQDSSGVIIETTHALTTGTGFVVTGGESVCLIECVAKQNGIGFLVPGALGVAVSDILVKECVSVGNIFAGFDATFSTRQVFVANAALNNGATPASGGNDSNYRSSGVTTSLSTAPYNQELHQNATYWDNVTA